MPAPKRPPEFPTPPPPPTPATSVSPNGVDLTKKFEGLSLRAYNDQVGVLTIGYGHTGPDVTPGLVWTEDKATEALQHDMQSAANCVNQRVTVPLNQNQFDALVDFVFNLGCGAFSGSHLLEYVNAGDNASAALQFVLWDHAGGEVSEGLMHRRIAEAALFSGKAE